MDGFMALGHSFFNHGIIFASAFSDPTTAEHATEGTTLNPWIMLTIAAVLVILNGFFVAAEFALVKVRYSQIDKMIKEKKMFAKMAGWLAERLDHSLSACQLGITMASLALGYVGEPAFAFLITPIFEALGVTSPRLLHIIAFIISFSVITSLHLVIGEQAPKIFAIRRPEEVVRWCALPMKFFYYLLFPFMYVLNMATEMILGWLGLGGDSAHGDAVHTEDEIRGLLREAHIHGQLTGSEHYLLNNVFEFDDLVVRLVMVPRSEVQVFDVNQPFNELLESALESRHTRYPVCDGSLDSLLGVVHMKDLLGIDAANTDFDIRTVMRPPEKVPENLPISEVLKHIQNTHQLLTFVVDEYGTIIGICTLENVLEKIIGPVDDEFDHADEPGIKPVGNGNYIILGNTPITEVETALRMNLDEADVDTLAGVLMSRLGKIPEKGDSVEFDGATAEVLAVKHDHAEKVRFTIPAKRPKKEEKA
jgi:CBS domain containing-hemolysin-like protein